LFIAKEAEVGRIFHNDLTLEEVVGRSRGIYLVKPADPFVRTEDIDITPKEEKGNTTVVRAYPPYVRRYYRYKVLEVLYGKTPEDKMEVLNANDGTRLGMHRKYHVEGISRSVAFSHYSQGLGDLEKQESMIAFVIFDKNGQASLVCDWSIERAAKKKEVLQLINKPTASE
jgi:hypothetical protein